MQQEDTATLEVLLKRLGLTTVHKLFSETVVTAEKEGWSYGTFLERLLSEEVAHRLKLALLLKWLGQSFPFLLPSRPLTSPSEVISKANAGSVLRTGTSQRQP